MPDLELEIDPAIEKKMFKELKDIEGFLDWIDKCLKNDLLNHFNASSETQRASIKAAAERLKYIKQQLVDADKPEPVVIKKTLSY